MADLPVSDNDLNIEDNLRLFVLQDDTLYAAIGERWYPDEAPQGAPRPYVVYEELTSERWRYLDGLNYVSIQMIQLNVIGDTRAQARDWSDRIRDILDESTKSGPTTWPYSRTVQRCKVIDTYSDSEERRDGSGQRAHRRVLDVEIHFEEA